MADKRSVWIATPIRSFEAEGELDLDTILSKLEPHHAEPIRQLSFWAECPWNIRLITLGGGGIYQARNKIATEFVQECTHDDDRLLFKDYDLMPTAQDYVNLLSHDLSICGGLYTVRADNGHWVMNRFNNDPPTPKGVIKAEELGTGFKYWKRKVFTKVLADNPWLDCESDSDHSKRFYSFFSMGPVKDDKLWPGKHRALTEDYWFDWLCRESGFITCADTNIQIRHKDGDSERVFPAVFPPNPGRLPAEAKEP